VKSGAAAERFVWYSTCAAFFSDQVQKLSAYQYDFKQCTSPLLIHAWYRPYSLISAKAAKFFIGQNFHWWDKIRTMESLPPLKRKIPATSFVYSPLVQHSTITCLLWLNSSAKFHFISFISALDVILLYIISFVSYLYVAWILSDRP
jgi:hypothetical protein